MNIDFELYRIFYIVAKNSNITKASEELHISQPAISKSIKSLEEQLGGQLFVRTKKGVTLTEEGKEFYNYISKAIEYITNAENKFNDLINLDTGTIRIGISSTLTKAFLLPYLEKFHSRYPNIIIRIDTSQTEVLIDKLKNGLIDLVILNLPYNNTNDIEFIKCKNIQDTFICGKKYKEILSNDISLKDLNNYPLIIQAKGSSARSFFDEYTKNNNITLKPEMELASYSLVVEFCKIGFGIGYSTKNFIKDELDNGELFELKIKEKIPKRYIGVAFSKKKIPTFATKKLINIILEKNS